MKILFSWLLDLIDTELSPKSLAESLTMSGTEVNALHAVGFESEHVLVGEILASEKHPQADRLSVCRVTVGKNVPPLQIVCGAKNYKVGNRVPVALPGAVLPSGLSIKKSKLRGVTSEGMMCSAEELSLPKFEDGLMILQPDAELGKRVDSLFPQDFVFEVEVTSNRPDLLSHLGIARELVGIGAARWKKQNPLAEISASNSKDEFKISIEDTFFCSHYTATIFRDVQMKKSPDWMSRRLESICQRPINFMVDLTNYLLHHIGQPMHVFDLDKLSGDTIFIRRAKDGEKLLTLDHNTYRLTEKDYVIADANAPLALAGIIGGEHSSVTANTKNVLLEIARFSPTAVRNTSRRMHISTDSSHRFERGIDPALPDFAQKYTLDLIHKELAIKPCFSAKVGSQTTVQAAAHKVPLRKKRVTRILGVELPHQEIFSRLTSLGFVSETQADAPLTHWRAPSWRLDIHREADLIEEIARTTPFEKILSSTFLSPAPSSQDDLEHDYHNCLRTTLSGLGWHEVLVSPLTNSIGKGPKIANPMTSDHTALRGELAHQMLHILSSNIDAGNSGLRLFSIGKIFLPDGSERYHLALIAAGPAHGEHWLEKKRALDVFDIKSALSALGLRHSEASYVSLSQMRERGFKTPVAYAEALLIKPIIHNHKFQHWPEHPAARRDVALVVNKSLPASELLASLNPPPTPLLDQLQIIDLYTDPEGRHIPVDCKTITIACQYRSAERTLTETEIDSAHESVKNSLLRIPGAYVRT